MGRSRTDAINAAGKGVVAALQDALQRAQASHKLLSANHTRTVQNLTDALANIDRVQVRFGVIIGCVQQCSCFPRAYPAQASLHISVELHGWCAVHGS